MHPPPAPDRSRRPIRWAIAALAAALPSTRAVLHAVTRLRTLATLAALSAAVAILAAAPAPARGAEQLLATMTAPGSGARVQTSVALQQGQTYRLVLGGTVVLDYASLGRREDVDAIYCFFHAGGPTLPNDDCTEQPPGPRSVVPFFLDFGGDPANRRSPDGLAGRVLPYRADHRYDFGFVAPASGPLGAYVRGFTNATGTGGIAIELHGEPPAPPPPPAPSSPPTTPTGPTGPRIVPRTTPPVPGVVTSYAAPRPGTAIALPFPANGCTPPATTNQANPGAGDATTCEVDIFLKRNGGGQIDSPDAIFAVDGKFRYDFGETPEAKERARKVCLYFALDALTEDDPDLTAFERCVTAVSRILKRAEDLRRKREGQPNVSTSHAARRCHAGSARLRGQARRRPPVSLTCRRSATFTRLTLRSALEGATIADLVGPSSKLVIGRGNRVRQRPGDRIEVLWRIRPPRTTTTIRVPAPLALGSP